MKKILHLSTLTIFLSLLFFAHSNAQLFSSKRNILQFEDPIKGHLWSKIDFNLRSNEYINANRGRYNIGLTLLKQGIENDDFYFLNLFMQTGLRDFPLISEAYFTVNDEIHKIRLNDIRSETYNLEETSEETDSCGASIQEIKTSNFQLFRKEAEVSNILRKYKYIESASLLLYSGRMPILFDFDSNTCKKLELILEY